MMHLTLLMSLIVFLNLNVEAREFGRFFTSPEQRQRLDETRQQDGKQIQIHEADLFIEPEQVEQPQAVIQDSIHLKGLVYRSGNRNTAWVNDNNSYEGGMGSGMISINAKDITSNNVKMNLPGMRSAIDMKVGQEYEPQSGRIRDINQGINQ